MPGNTKSRVSKTRVAYNRALLYGQYYLNPLQALPMILYLTGLAFIYRTLSPLNSAVFTILLTQAYAKLSHVRNKSKAVRTRLLRLARAIPVIDNKVQKELISTYVDIENEEFEHRAREQHIIQLPEQGISAEELIQMLKDSPQQIRDITKISGGLYTDPADTSAMEARNKVHALTLLSNPMHDDLWGYFKRLETDVGAICLDLYKAPNGASALKTSGGTLSIFAACLAAKRRLEDQPIPSTQPTIIVSDRAHPAFEKACEFLGIHRISIKTDPLSFKMDLHALQQAIDGSNVHDIALIVANGPAFSEGIIDDVAEIADFGEDYGIPVMADCCLGGFLLPFCKAAGIDIPEISFEAIPNLWAITCDTHKYGEGEKGNSVVMFRNYNELGQYAGFESLLSNMGYYASIGIEGSRPTKLGDWLMLLMRGREGFESNLKNMIQIKNTICDAVNTMDDVHISGDPRLPIFAIRANTQSPVNALLVASKMKEKHWEINGLPNPAGFHFCITPANLVNPSFASDFIRDLEASIAYAKAHPHEKPRGTLGMYDTLGRKLPPGTSDVLCAEIGYTYLGITNAAQRRFTDDTGAVLPQYAHLLKKKSSGDELKETKMTEDSGQKNNRPKAKIH